MLNGYAARVLAVPLHPCRELIVAHFYYGLYDAQKQLLSAFCLTHREFHEMNIEYEQITQIHAYQTLALFKLSVLAMVHATLN